MTLRENYKIENDGIWISSKELESWRDHYSRIANDCEYKPFKEYFNGKADVLADILKTFEPLEP